MIADRKILKPNSETRPDLHLCSILFERVLAMHAAVSIIARYTIIMPLSRLRASQRKHGIKHNVATRREGGKEGQNGVRRDRQRPRLIHGIIRNACDPSLRLEYADLNIPLRAGIAIIAFSLNYNIIRIYIYIYIRFICVFCKHRKEIDSLRVLFNLLFI